MSVLLFEDWLWGCIFLFVLMFLIYLDVFQLRNLCRLRRSVLFQLVGLKVEILLFFRYIQNIRELRLSPCDAPIVISKKFDVLLQVLIVREVFERRSVINVMLTAERNLEQVLMNKFLYIVSNAVEISILVIMLFVFVLCKVAIKSNGP